MKKFLFGFILPITVTLLIAGCGNKSNAIPPKPLVDFTPTVHAEYIWDRNIGSGTDGTLDVKLAPNVDGNVIYTSSYDGYISAVNAQTGENIWYTNTHLKLTSSPAISGDFIVAGSLHAKLIALNKDNGKVLWTTDIPSSLFAKPTIADNTIYLQTHDGSISAYDLKTGKQKWNESTSTPDLMLVGNSSPVVFKGLVLAGTSSGSLWGFNQDTGAKQWDNPIALPQSGSQAQQMVDINATPLISGASLYIATFQGNLMSFDTQMGVVNWQKKASVFNNFAIDNKALFVTDASGDVTAYALKTGDILWKKDILEGRKTSAPLYYQGKVFVGDYEGYVHIFDASTGKYLGRVDIGGDGIRAQPAISDGNIIVQTNDGTLAAIKL
ncbi:outer membrane protein assembly factor BamB [Fangia hongkongensis]|uniref:outer membrane protein assembly factor BamB n=1 Tax=Fangia hongkongensis TaxID=270495 RepID=UPI00038146C9|nr:outer membrane protein assembly factor BamB [Fangia hongkongensis]MBK2125572.1 outer membrane protein assembly factor BamB [Fangia hongkongensis]